MKMVRDGQKVWPYCHECGCRLEKVDDYFRHFGFAPYVERDARGCLCSHIHSVFKKHEGIWWYFSAPYHITGVRIGV